MNFDLDELYEKVVGLESDMCNMYDILKQRLDDDFDERFSMLESRIKSLEEHFDEDKKHKKLH